MIRTIWQQYYSLKSLLNYSKMTRWKITNFAAFNLYIYTIVFTQFIIIALLWLYLYFAGPISCDPLSEVNLTYLIEIFLFYVVFITFGVKSPTISLNLKRYDFSSHFHSIYCLREGCRQYSKHLQVSVLILGFTVISLLLGWSSLHSCILVFVMTIVLAVLPFIGY
jgi:hypothetical protein